MKNNRLIINKVCSYLIKFIIFINIISFFGCYPALIRQAQSPEEALRKVHFFYPKFQDDMDLSSLALAIGKNIKYLKRLDPEYIFHYGPHKFTRRHVLDSQETLLDLIRGGTNGRELNKKIRKHFLVYKATGRVMNSRVLFTGYFEPIYKGSLRPDSIYRYPIYKKPDDLLKINLSLFKKEFKGKSIIARIEGKQVLPYYSRKQIEIEKVLKGKELEIAWLKDPIDVTFLHIQGSGRLRLPDDRTISVGYQAANGLPYRSIGRYMLDMGFLSREKMSMQSIRSYLTDHTEVIEEVLNYNPSYVFFRSRDDGKVFEECTNMIINQVEELKRLVNEFSSFARMPSADLTPNNITQIIKESTSLYRETQKNIGIVFNDSIEVPVFNVDKEQMKRVMINLLDNAIDAIDGKGEIVIDLTYEMEQEMVRIEVLDNGKGIPPDHKMRLFEPYFSTKKHGTGLGLAIVNTIISDHNGFIRVQDNRPRGTKFIIELPVRI